MDILGFQKDLLAWFVRHQRPLPWRKDYLPYHVWIAEIMLQQTQMDRGVAYFQRFLERFPRVEDLAAAPEDELLKHWEGLGYYSRAHNLRRAAGIMLDRHKGQVPRNYQALLALPGIGPYTAAAILSQAFNDPWPVVDANVERVLARVADLDQPIKSSKMQRLIQSLAHQLMPHCRPRDFNQAMMELGGLVCRKKPDCESCPISRHCESLRLGIVNERPVPGRKPEIQHVEVVTGVLWQDGRVLIQKRLPDDVWAGLWEFPGGRPEDGETLEAALVREFMEELELEIEPESKLSVIKHGYTRYRVTLHCFKCRLAGSNRPVLHAATEYRWAALDELADFAFPAGHRRLIDQMLQEKTPF